MYVQFPRRLLPYLSTIRGAKVFEMSLNAFRVNTPETFAHMEHNTVDVVAVLKGLRLGSTS